MKNLEWKTTMRISLILSLILIALSGCVANPYKTYYTDLIGYDVSKLSTVEQYSGDPKVFSGSSDADNDVFSMRENGYFLIGHSIFNVGSVSKNDVVKQGKEIYAETIIVYSEYTGTQTGMVPLTLPTTQTYNTNFSGSSYALGVGTIQHTGTARTTTSGMSTTYIPYSVNRSDYLALYFVKLKPTVIGIHENTIPTEVRKEIGTNKGVYVEIVILGSPAFNSDIIIGDVIFKIGDLDTFDIKSYTKAIREYRGKTVEVSLYRKDKILKKNVTLNQGNYSNTSDDYVKSVNDKNNPIGDRPRF